MPSPARLFLALTLALTSGASVARADYPETVRDHILPGYLAFAETTAALAEAASASCATEGMTPAFHAAYDAWMRVQHLRFGPVETNGRALAIHFWPDPKGAGARAQMALLAGDPAQLTPEVFAQQSVAVRGFPALERLIYPERPLPADPCPLIRATASDLAGMAAAVLDDWQGGYADQVITAGESGNTVFQTRKEARQMMFTQIATALEILDDQRLGRPLGTAEEPHPERAEARASGRSARNVTLALTALREMAQHLTPDAPLTDAAFVHALDLLEALEDPIFAGVAEPNARLKVEIIQQSVAHLREMALGELGPELDVGLGFNAADGD